MKVTEKLKKMRDSSAEELHVQEAEMKEQMFRLRFQWSMGQTESLNKMRVLRKDQARMQTILRDKVKGQ